MGLSIFGCAGSLLLTWAPSSCGEQGLLSPVVRQLLIVVEHRLSSSQASVVGGTWA